MSLSTALPLST